MAAVTEGTILWTPPPQRVEAANITRFARWAGKRTGRSFDRYAQLWSWSVTEINEFWGSLWDYFDITASVPDADVLVDRAMPGARCSPRFAPS